MGQPADFWRYRPANENGFALTQDIHEHPAQIDDPTEPARVARATFSLNISTSKERDVHRATELRANRAEIFGEGSFSEPAWDMLLKLYSAGLSGRAESLSNVCLASGVLPSTALRWLQHLQGEGWIERSFDPGDRQFLIALSAKSRTAMTRLFGHSPDQISDFK
jgi:DNA-binding MarR family transcriptional regulator